jgi:hypothetical protein
MVTALSCIAVLALALTTGLGFHVLRRPKQLVPDTTRENKDRVDWPDLSRPDDW